MDRDLVPGFHILNELKGLDDSLHALTYSTLVFCNGLDSNVTFYNDESEKKMLTGIRCL